MEIKLVVGFVIHQSETGNSKQVWEAFLHGGHDVSSRNVLQTINLNYGTYKSKICTTQRKSITEKVFQRLTDIYLSKPQLYKR
jgi:hypothetical protein